MATKDTQTKLKNWEPNPDITPEELEEMVKDYMTLFKDKSIDVEIEKVKQK